MIRPRNPDGFDAFWRGTVAEAESATLDYALGPPVSVEPAGTGQTNPGTITTEHEIRTFDFRGIGGERLNGWIATPDEALSPGFLWIAPYGRESAMPNQYGTRPGFVSLSFNFFGRPSFLEEVYKPANGYLADGVLDPETWIFRRMFQNAVIAGRVLADLPQTDASRLASMGMSQGGGMSVWLGAQVDWIKAVCADMPFLGGMHEALVKNVYRYPLKELVDFMERSGDRDRVLRTISFFDTVNQASRCVKPTLVSVGLKDPAVKPVQARSVFEALPGEKRLIDYDWGHDWHPDMIENNRSWLDRWLTGAQ